ncbi:hypothetical protein PAXRUDRAFT_149395, partial [Paxillus rubicundulus Ve08.2h10]
APTVYMVSSGIALSSRGELNFDTTGSIHFLGPFHPATLFESSCLAMIKIFLHGLKTDRLVSLHH